MLALSSSEWRSIGSRGRGGESGDPVIFFSPKIDQVIEVLLAGGILHWFLMSVVATRGISRFESQMHARRCEPAWFMTLKLLRREFKSCRAISNPGENKLPSLSAKSAIFGNGIQERCQNPPRRCSSCSKRTAVQVSRPD